MERVIEIEHATFTPLVFGTNGGMRRECALFIKNLAMKLAEKENEQYSDVITSIRTKLSFCILKAVFYALEGQGPHGEKKHKTRRN